MPAIYERVLNKWDGMMMMNYINGFLHNNMFSLNRSNLNKTYQSV